MGLHSFGCALCIMQFSYSVCVCDVFSDRIVRIKFGELLPQSSSHTQSIVPLLGLVFWCMCLGVLKNGCRKGSRWWLLERIPV